MRTHNDFLRAGVRAYNFTYDIPFQVIEGHWAAVNEREACLIAGEYHNLPVLAEGVGTIGAYRALRLEIEQQYNFATKVLGIRCEPTLDDPYQCSADMCRDVAENKRLKVYAGETEHPYLTDDEQVHFRFVHDLFGHATEGYSFGPRGEQNAWIHHSMMFSALAQLALTTETRGQNSWVNFGPHSNLPVTERPFAPQKVALLPAWCCDWQAAMNQED